MKLLHLASSPAYAVLLISSIGGSGLASAAEPNCSKPTIILEVAQCNKELNCDTAATTFEIAQCAALAQNNAELRLDAAYQETLGKMEDAEQAPERQKFIEAQAAWRAYRDAYCKAVYESYQGGTLRGAAFSGCMKERADSRVFELNEYPHNR